MDQLLFAGQASIWVQPDGANTEPKYLGCHELGDVTEDQGDLTLVYCPDPAKAGKFKVAGSFAGEPGVPTSSITARLGRTADWLERVVCPASIFVHKVTCGRRDLFTNWDRSFIFRNARITSKGLSALAAREPGSEAPSEQSFDLSMEEVLRIYGLSGDRQNTLADCDLLAITFCKDQKCADACGPAADLCQYGVAVGTVPAGSAMGFACIYKTEDGGGTWSPAGTNPFGGGIDLSAVVCFDVARGVTRILVAKGTAEIGEPAQVAYSDDDGATWTLVDVGATNGQYVLQAEGLFALDMYNIWLVTNGGYVYHSGDGGVTWEEQEAGVVTNENLICVEFVDAETGYAAGESNTVMSSGDGGVSWTLLAGPVGKALDDVFAMEVIDENTVWLGYNDGELWYTEDAGATWLQRTVPFVGGIINSIDFANTLVGFLLHDTVGFVGTVYRTIDGGYTWQAVATPDNDGLNAIHVCDSNTAFAVGNVVDRGTAFIGKVYPA